MNIKDIKAIYNFLKKTDLVELELEGPDGKLRLKRGSAPVGPAPQMSEIEVSPTREIKQTPSEKPMPDNIRTVAAPMVGTFYRAPAPDAEDYVDVGGVVKKGQTLCIIEAMKLMNEVECEFNGKVSSILVENGQPVEYGEPLFYIEVAK